MKITVANLAPAPFVQQVALAFHEGNQLAELWTTLAFRPGGILDRFGGRRSVTQIPWDRVRTVPAPEIVRLLAGKLRRGRLFEDRVFHWMRDRFEAAVSKRALDQCDVIYAYETQCEHLFAAAREQGVATILDLPSPEHDFVARLLADEQRKYPAFEETEPAALREHQARRTASRLRECELATLIVANSEFTRQSWVAAGVPEEKIRVLHLGSPTPVRSPSFRNDGAVRFIWAGTFGMRKGAHYLMEAWRKLAPGKAAEFHVYGSQALPRELIADLPDNIFFHGPISQRELFAEYELSDLLVFPTLCDGFGLVVTEAMAHGLPVLTTDRAGAADFVTPGTSGLLVRASDAEDLAHQLSWCLDHPAELRGMREAAVRAVADWQWGHYREKLRAIVSPSLTTTNR